MPVLAGTNLKCHGTTCFQPFLAIMLGQRQQSETGSVAMFWMFVLGHDPGDRFGRGWTDSSPPMNESFWCPLLVRPVCCWHVIFDGAESADSGKAWMTGNAFTTMQQLNHRLGHARFQNLTDQCMRHAVTMPLNIDVVVDMYFNGFKPRNFIRLAGNVVKAGASMAVNVLARLPGSF